MVAFEADQRDYVRASELDNCVVGVATSVVEMPEKNSTCVLTARTERVAVGSRIPEEWFVPICDLDCFDSCRQRLLGEATSSRDRLFADINENVYARRHKNCDELVDRSTLVADRCDPARETAGCAAPAEPRSHGSGAHRSPR